MNSPLQQGKARDGKPTGRLNAHNQMEVEIYIMDGDKRVSCGNRWIEITPEQRQAIEGRNVVVSMGASTETVEKAENTHVRVDNDGRALFETREKKDSSDAPQIRELRDLEFRAINVTSDGTQPSMFVGTTVTTDPMDQWTTALQKAKPVFEKSTLQPNDERRKVENSGFNVNYYSVEIKHPKRKDRAPYIFEVEDLIQALNLGFHEGTILKSLVRSATERELGLAKVGNDAIRDAEKMVHSSQEELRARKLKRGLK